jgi:peptidyl-prolyl cis-trans isomerase D
MLEVMRTNVKSSIVTTLVFGVLIFVFVFAFGRGSSGFTSRSTESWAAKVNGDLVTATDFTQAYSNRFRQQSQMRGGKYTIDQAKADNLKKTVLDSLVDQELIAQQAGDLGIAVSDSEVADAIAKNPQFQQDGKFDFDYYKKLVENGYGMNISRFEAAWRRDLLRAKVVQSALAGAQVSDDELKAAYIAAGESASISYVRLNSFMFREKATVTDADADTYAKAHEAELRKKYEDEKVARWTQPPAVKVRALTVSLKPGASSDDEKAARARMDAAVAEIKGGKEFAEVVKARSEDESLKAAGGDLGFIAKGQSPYGKTLEEEALKLSAGQMGGVFKDRTGFHVLKAEEVRASKIQAFEEVQHQMAMDAVKADKAKQLAKQKADETLAALRTGKNLTDLFPPKKPSTGQFDFASFTTPQSAETESFHPTGGYVAGIGVAPALSNAVFALTSAGALPAAPVEESESWYVFKIKSRERADLSKFDEAEKAKLRDQLVDAKQRGLYTSWIEGLRKNAKIATNDGVLSYELSSSDQSYNPDDY